MYYFVGTFKLLFHFDTNKDSMQTPEQPEMQVLWTNFTTILSHKKISRDVRAFYIQKFHTHVQSVWWEWGIKTQNLPWLTTNFICLLSGCLALGAGRIDWASDKMQRDTLFLYPCLTPYWTFLTWWQGGKENMTWVTKYSKKGCQGGTKK